MLDVGSVVAGRYRVEGELGRGGMGRVLLARHLVLGEHVALKIVQTDAALGDAPRARLLREARAAARLRGDYVVRVRDVFSVSAEDDRRGGDVGALCLVLEHVAGPTLARELAERGPLPVAEAATIVLQLAAGLAEAHAHGIVHRDLKPTNVLLATLPSGRRRPRIIDFGIAKARVSATTDATLTAEGSLLGSPVYMAPEQIVDPHGVDARADVWSLGVILYELLTGGLPFEGLTTAGLLARIERDPPRSPVALRPDLSAELVALLLRCLEKEASARFADVTALGQALAPFAPEGDLLAEEIAQTEACPPTAAALAEAEPPLLDAVGSLTTTDEPLVDPFRSSRSSVGAAPGERPAEAPRPDASPASRRSLVAPIASTVLGLALLGAYFVGRPGASSPVAASSAAPTLPALSAVSLAGEGSPSAIASVGVTLQPAGASSVGPPATVHPLASAAPKPIGQKRRTSDEVAPPDVFDRLGPRK